VLLPWSTGIVMAVALYMVFVAAPTERDQGVVQRIFYFHVAAAWMAFAGFALVAIASVWFLARGERRADRLAQANAEVGMLYTTVVLVTGPIWARPAWGTWWTWDPRLTMTVVLWTIYAAYLMLRRLGGGDEALGRYAAVLGAIGALDIPLIIVSIRLWRGIHPAVMLAKEQNAGLKDPTMKLTLLISGIALALLFTWLVSLRVRLARVDEELTRLGFQEEPA
jgi:heme exporter protein C